MSKRNRNTLKKFFSEGALPSEDQFADLIDSTLNMVDEGFSKTPTNGFEVSCQGNMQNLISFFRMADPNDPLWSISLSPTRNTLTFQQVGSEEEGRQTVLTLSDEGMVGIGQKEPQSALDVAGVAKMEGRMGIAPPVDAALPEQQAVLADGKWHDITPTLRGCHGFEVVAGAGKRKTGQYAMIHAIAMNTFNPTGWFFNFLNLKKRIKIHHAYYHTWGQKLKLRWTPAKRDDDYEYRLQIRSNSDYGEGIKILYHITKLWHDETMEGSWGSDHGN